MRVGEPSFRDRFGEGWRLFWSALGHSLHTPGRTLGFALAFAALRLVADLVLMVIRPAVWWVFSRLW